MFSIGRQEEVWLQKVLLSCQKEIFQRDLDTLTFVKLEPVERTGEAYRVIKDAVISSIFRYREIGTIGKSAESTHEHDPVGLVHLVR